MSHSVHFAIQDITWTSTGLGTVIVTHPKSRAELKAFFPVEVIQEQDLSPDHEFSKPMTPYFSSQNIWPDVIASQFADAVEISTMMFDDNISKPAKTILDAKDNLTPRRWMFATTTIQLTGNKETKQAQAWSFCLASIFEEALVEHYHPDLLSALSGDVWGIVSNILGWYLADGYTSSDIWWDQLESDPDQEAQHQNPPESASLVSLEHLCKNSLGIERLITTVINMDYVILGNDPDTNTPIICSSVHTALTNLVKVSTHPSPELVLSH